ncbi:MAG: DNA translocase FtsK 4TM domain-containing protein [Flavobacteriaceae bacterium]|jgi:S-DNA-T family DNA segregation ATPase FtsK/SpoIIIE|nr:DNA translocase FtsK 4TM domain-containing protein [Flavobacteriaceae bacterium]
MARKSTHKTTQKRFSKFNFTLSNSQRLVMGSFLVISGILLFIALLSYFFTGESDQTVLGDFTNRSIDTNNWLSKVGAWISHLLIYKGFGVTSFIGSGLLLLSGISVLANSSKKRLWRNWFWGTLVIIWGSMVFGFVFHTAPKLGGTIGFELNILLQDYVGKIGTALMLVFCFIVYVAIRFKVGPQHIARLFIRTKNELKSELSEDHILSPVAVDNSLSDEAETVKSSFEIPLENLEPTISNHSSIDAQNNLEVTPPIEEENSEDDTIEMKIEANVEEVSETDNLAAKLVDDFIEVDPTLELSKFQFPPLDLLKKYNTEGITINQEELEENKNKIVETLNNYKIGIANIKATIGPTVTLYEIIPEAGVRISKIKNLEDDIALSLSALGIRIIAPIPGRGTIGIEVPNKNATIVSMHSVIASQKFQKSEMELPIALGKTISNETFVVDLAKMPHLLMAGATGQGKSVGLNAVLTSLLYKKHPAEVKFVLVDPKKVELTLFNKIERHYLAKLPDSEDAIITDNTKVINTLNSLCIEMDNRYELLKNAFCRNIKEYNEKFKARKLNPNDGHKFLPYIVLVVDEFADLIMTAGKEVETPIARLAQLARAIGIHLIVATQRPSVNVITGIIKANFPARIAFRVTSKIDSRTILDSSGADQLIGRGDLLYNQGNDMIRIQCAFVDTPEVEKLTDYIGAQKAYPSAYLLPEYVSEDSGTSLDNNIDERDQLFREAAEVIVTAQQGSASLLQRKLKLGYNRAGRLIDQLEAAGIVGPFEGSKARQVLIPDFLALNQLLDQETE